MKNKQIIIIIGIIFIALVGYKLISSNIQENKEKAVLQEKIRLETEPLNQCLDLIDKNTEFEIKNYEDQVKDLSSPESQAFCLEPTGHGSIVDNLIASGKMTLKEYCAPPTFEERAVEAQKIRDKAKIAKEECYRRYK